MKRRGVVGWYAAVVVDRPWLILLLSLLLSAACLPGLRLLRVNNDFMNEATPFSSDFPRIQRHQNQFNRVQRNAPPPPDTTTTTIKPNVSQAPTPPRPPMLNTFYHIPIMGRHGEADFLKPQFMSRALNISHFIQKELSYEIGGKNFTLSEICRRAVACDVGNSEMEQFFMVWQEAAKTESLVELLDPTISYPVISLAGNRYLSSDLLHDVTLHPGNASLARVGGLTFRLVFTIPRNHTNIIHVNAFEEALLRYIESFDNDPDIQLLSFSFRFLGRWTWDVIFVISLSVTGGLVGAAATFSFLMLRVGPGNVKMFLCAALGAASLAGVLLAGFGVAGYAGISLLFSSIFVAVAVYLNGLICQTTLITAWVVSADGVGRAGHLEQCLRKEAAFLGASSRVLLTCVVLIPLASTPAIFNLSLLMPILLLSALIHSFATFPALLVLLDATSLPINCDKLFLIPSLASVCRRKVAQCAELRPRALSLSKLFFCIVFTVLSLCLGLFAVRVDFRLKNFFPPFLPVHDYLAFSQAEMFDQLMDINCFVNSPPDFDNATEVGHLNSLMEEVENFRYSTKDFPHNAWLPDYQAYLATTGALDSYDYYNPEAYADYEYATVRRASSLSSNSSTLSNYSALVAPTIPVPNWHEAQWELPEKPFLHKLDVFLGIGAYHKHRPNLVLDRDPLTIRQFKFNAYFSRVNSWAKRMELDAFLGDLATRYADLDVSFLFSFGFLTHQVAEVVPSWLRISGLFIMAETAVSVLFGCRKGSDWLRVFGRGSGALLAAFVSIGALSLVLGHIGPLFTIPAFAGLFYGTMEGKKRRFCQARAARWSMGYAFAMLCSWVTMGVAALGLWASRIPAFEAFAAALLLSSLAAHLCALLRLSLLNAARPFHPARLFL